MYINEEEISTPSYRNNKIHRWISKSKFRETFEVKKYHSELLSTKSTTRSMSIRFTTGKFPLDEKSRDDSGIPWGCVVQPFSREEVLEDTSELPLADEIARCDQCFAYINGFCTLERVSWRCSLCDAVNYFADASYKRYGNRKKVSELPELSSSFVELDVNTKSTRDKHDTDEDEDEEYVRDTYFDRPVYIAMVDATGQDDFLELVKSALTAALEALNPDSLFGLVTFGPKVS